MGQAAEDGLLEKAAGLATKKVAEIAGGFLGGGAGRYAVDAVRRYAPSVRKRFRQGANLARRDPLRAIIIILATGAALSGLWMAFHRAKEQPR